MPSSAAHHPAPERRSFLGWLRTGWALSPAAIAGIPFIGYLFGARKAPVEWLKLGPVTGFPLNQTRLVTFNNPIRQPWDGMVAHTGVFVRYEGRDEREADETKSTHVSSSWLSTAPTWAVRSSGSGVGAVHVPLSWRRLLRQRRTRLRAAAARPVPLRSTG